MPVETWRSGAALSQEKGETKHRLCGDVMSHQGDWAFIYHCVNYVETGEHPRGLVMRAYSTPLPPLHTEPN